MRFRIGPNFETVPTMKDRAGRATICRTFEDVFRAELEEIRERHNRVSRRKVPDNVTELCPTTALELTRLACSGGGIRSAAFCLGVLQGLQSKDVIRSMDYLSTVSGGGYIGTTMTIGMSSSDESAPEMEYFRSVASMNSARVRRYGTCGTIRAICCRTDGAAHCLPS